MAQHGAALRLPRIRRPALEALELFTTKSGEEIVGQLYNFTDKASGRYRCAPR